MHRPRSFSVYVYAVVAAGVALAVAALLTESRAELLGPRPLLFLTFCTLLALAESRPVMWLRRKQGAVITAAPSFNAALLFLVPGLGAAVAAGLISAFGDLTCGRPPLKTSFNAAMMTLTMGAASLILQLGGGRLRLVEGGVVTPAWIVIVILALLTYNIVNDVLVGVVVALNERLPVWSVLRGDLIRNGQADGVLLALGPVMVVVAMRSLLLLPALLVVTIIVLNTTRMALEQLHQATHDPLTGLPNRRLFDQHLEALLEKGKGSTAVAVLLIDLDGFKEINDTLGHDIGDRVLESVARRLQDAVPDSGMVARLGGDEFAVLVTDSLAADSLRLVGEGIHAGMTGSLSADGIPIVIAGSIGAARREADDTGSTLMRRADLAMYRAKSAGGGVQVHDAAQAGSSGSGRLALMDQLGMAISNEELFVEYQPIVDLASGATLHVEALVRWQHPERGLIGPNEFIPTAEQTELIGPLTTWVLGQAMRDCGELERLGHSLGIAVNLSAQSIADLGFPKQVRGLLEASGLSPDRLTLELTENTVLTDTSRAVQVMGNLRRMGARLAMDDFGTGFSSLANLRHLPLDVVKVDRSFVTNMTERPEDQAIVAAVIALANALGIETVAEGIEGSSTMDLLRQMGCDHAQGFHIGRPMGFHALERWLAEREAITPLAAPGMQSLTGSGHRA